MRNRGPNKDEYVEVLSKLGLGQESPNVESLTGAPDPTILKLWQVHAITWMREQEVSPVKGGVAGARSQQQIAADVLNRFEDEDAFEEYEDRFMRFASFSAGLEDTASRAQRAQLFESFLNAQEEDVSS